MKNCDTCIYFFKVKTWKDGRKGICQSQDGSIAYMKGKPCEWYESKKYIRKNEKLF